MRAVVTQGREGRVGTGAPIAALDGESRSSVAQSIRIFFDLFKLRIGLVIGVTALAGIAVTPGRPLPAWQVIVLALAVVVSSASAGAFNQYVERDLDARMARTRGRPFVTGRLRHGPRWLWLIGLMCAAAVAGVAVLINLVAALYVFLGAFFYAIVYTLWLKRRTWLNIVVGGLAGSFALLAGAAAVAPGRIDAVPLTLAIVLFLWTPPHFWSLSIAYRKDYEAAGVPMLPVVVGDARSARVILASAVALVVTSLLPVWLGAGWIYLLGAAGGGCYFIAKTLRLARDPNRATAMAAFHASLLQLSVLLVAAIADAAL
jgi:protoheme IX farnesyltransferase